MRTVLAAALISLSLVEGCNSAKPNTATAANTSSTPTVEVVRVVSRPLNIEVQLPGELQPYESVAVFPSSSSNAS